MSRKFKYKDVLQAWMDGKDIQATCDGMSWSLYSLTHIPNLENGCLWRIAPQKITIWTNVYRTRTEGYTCIGKFPTQQCAIQQAPKAMHDWYVKTISIEEEVSEGLRPSPIPPEY